MGKHEKDLEYFKNLKYNTVVRKNNGKFLLYIPELSLLEENKNIDKAYEKLVAAKEKYFQKMIEMEIKDEIVEPALFGRKRLETGLIPFFIKLLSVAAVVVVLLATIDELSSTFKYIKRASKSIARGSDISRTAVGTPNNLSIEERVFKTLEATDRYHASKAKNKKLSEEYMVITPSAVYESDHFSVHNVQLAFDSHHGTFWHATDNEGFVAIKCNKPAKLEAFSITARHDIPGMQLPDKTIVEGSNDNNNWERIAEVPQILCGKGESKVIFIENDKEYAYYKLNFSKWLPTSHISAAEISLFSKNTENASGDHSK